MTINTNAVLLNYKNEPIIQKDGVEEKELTVKEALTTSLNSTGPGEILTADKKNKIFQLSLKIHANDQLELTVDDAAFIKERVGIIYSAIVYGRICEILGDIKT